MHPDKDREVKDKEQRRYIVMFLIVLTLVGYWRVQYFEFVNYDDDVYVIDNIHVLSGLTKDGIAWAATTFHFYNWHPLTWLSLMLDHELYGNHPAGYHWTNVLFHIANTLLLFLALARMTGAPWRSGFVAALFAIHPLHVESVAWVAERKDVLSTFFWMLTMYFYALYAERPHWKRYLPVLVCFALGLTAKPMLVTLPFVLLLLDYWPLRRFSAAPPDRRLGRRDGVALDFRAATANWFPLFREKIPFILLSVASGIVTFAAQKSGGAVSGLAQVSFADRIANAFVSYASYIYKMFWPFDLAVFYPLSGTWPWWQVGASLLLFAGVTALVWIFRRYRYLPVGWLWYVGTLVPVIGLVQVGSQAMADRYTYIPLTGLFVMMAWGVPVIARRFRVPRLAPMFAAGLIVASLTVCTIFQLQYWQDGVSLFQHAARVTKANSITANNLGNALARKGRLAEAVGRYEESIRLKPDHAEAYNNLGNVLMLQGKAHEAIAGYLRAIQLEPRHAKAHFNLGAAYAALGRNDEAIRYYNETLQIRPDFAAAYNNLGIVYANRGDLDRAIENFRKALAVFPGYRAARDNLNIAVKQKGAVQQRSP